MLISVSTIYNKSSDRSIGIVLGYGLDNRGGQFYLYLYYFIIQNAQKVSTIMCFNVGLKHYFLFLL